MSEETKEELEKQETSVDNETFRDKFLAEKLSQRPTDIKKVNPNEYKMTFGDMVISEGLERERRNRR